MHHRATREIETRDTAARERIEQAALAPHHVGHREVNDEAPEDGEQQHGAEFHALGERPRDQRGRDNGEHQLVDHEGLLGNGGGVIGIGRGAHVVQEGELANRPCNGENSPNARL